MKLSRLLRMRLMWSHHGMAKHCVITGCRSRACGGLWNVTEYGLELKDQIDNRSTNIINAIGGSSCLICKPIDTKAVVIVVIGSIARRARPGSNQSCGETFRNSIPV